MDNVKRIRKTKFADYAIIAAMAVLMALNYDLFVVRNKFAPSGLNGVATMIDYLTGGKLNLAYMSLVINVPLCVLAYFFAEKDFALKTLAASLVSSAFFVIMMKTCFMYFSVSFAFSLADMFC